ncbi:hypothetical protein [Streptomyces sp. Isolate_45]|uniref:hypothetical protein n=1 Tax=Streptomyces sp. Isolate_45 TaxID=2950111 RepID=UPI002481BDAF|nr:hypothetical protein [Streptomyces sp. Isolate_45]MDA5280932.1 hypothetical protein [Streptomyces sp. Isolate_45]
MTVSRTLRTAFVTVALAGAAVLGTQAAHADGAASATTLGAGPQATPAAGSSTNTNPWD